MILILFIYSLVCITSLVVDSVIDVLRSNYIYSSLITLLLIAFIIILLMQLIINLVLILLISRSLSITGNSSYYIPIYQDFILILTSYWFKLSITLFEVLIHISSSSIYHVWFISSIQVLTFITLLLLFIILYLFIINNSIN